MIKFPHSTTEKDIGVSLPRGWRILIVDDYKDTAEMLTTLLTLSGNECYTAYSGEEGLAMARFHRPEVILLDINMPKMNGFEACEKIRSESWSQHVRIVAFTGNSDELKNLRDHSGFDSYLVKPIDPEELAITLALLKPGRPEML